MPKIVESPLVNTLIRELRANQERIEILQGKIDRTKTEISRIQKVLAQLGHKKSEIHEMSAPRSRAVAA